MSNIVILNFMDAEYNFCLYFHQNSTQNILHSLSQAMTTLVINVKYHYWVLIILCIHAKFMNFNDTSAFTAAIHHNIDLYLNTQKILRLGMHTLADLS